MLTGLLLALALASDPASDADQIRAQRERSNAAIAAHDGSGLLPLYERGAHVIRGSSGAALAGPDAIVASLATAFADPTFVTYVRSPEEIAISQGGVRAAERGRWVGSWKKPDGVMRLSGVYLAMWTRRDGVWRLKSEAFVSLKCEGSRACGEVL